MEDPSAQPPCSVDGAGRSHGAHEDRPDGGDFDWDERYREAPQMWSGEPNASLVVETADLEPGRALDVGCGEGADAIWLARRGWQVTAIDVSDVALQRARAAALESGVEVAWLHAGLLDPDFTPGGYDLVTTHYPALRQTPNADAEHALLSAVAPCGHLLVVHHAPVAVEEGTTHGFDPSHCIAPGDVASHLDASWRVIVDELRPRHLISGAGAGHASDVVLHAVRVA